MKWINRKLKRRVSELENQINGLTRIVKLSIKCEECGKPAMYKICRRYIDSYIKDSLLCEECLNKLNRKGK